MPFLGIGLTFGGYLLVYAAVAAGGKFATSPWLGALADAYDTSSSSGSSDAASVDAQPATPQPAVGRSRLPAPVLA